MTAAQERRLAAILAADIVGYLRLIEADEAGTLAAVGCLWREVLIPMVRERHGRVVKLMGDGAIVEFASVVDAVGCAVGIQESVAARQASVAAERVPEPGSLLLLGGGLLLAARARRRRA